MAGHPIDIQIGATLSGTLGSAVRGAQAQLGQLGSTISNLSQQQAGVGRLGNMRTQAAQSARDMRAAQARVRAAQAAVDAAGPGNATRTQTRELERAIAAAGRAEQAYRRQRGAVDQLSDSLREAGVDTRNLGSEQDRIGSQLERVRSRTEALTRATQAQQRNMEARANYRGQMMDAAALGIALAAPIKSAIEFESVMADVKKVVDFDTPEQFKAMSNDVLMLSTRIPMAADQLGDIMATAGQSNIPRDELLAFTEDAAKMGKAFDISGAEAGKAMAGMRSIFGLAQPEVVSLGDAINHLSNNMAATAGDLLNISNRTGSTAKLFGLSAEQTNALGAAFLDLKTPPEVASTGINALLLKLSTADKQSKKFQDGLASIGLSAGDLKKDIEADAQGALLEFLRTVEKAPDKMGVLSDLFGAEYADDIAKLVGSLDTYEQAVELVADKTQYAGSMQKEYDARAATTENSMRLLGNSVKALGTVIGSVLLPPLVQLTNTLSPIIVGMAKWADAHPQLTTALVGTLAGAIALKIGVVGLGYAFTFIKGPILAAQTAIAAVRAQMALISVGAATGPLASMGAAFTRAAAGARALGLALVANPVGLTIAAIGAAVVGLALVIRKYWEPLSAFVSGLFQGISAAIQPAIAGISAALAPIKAAFEPLAPLFDWIGSALGKIVGWFGSLLTPVQLSGAEFEKFASIGQQVGSVIGGVLSAGLQAITPPLQLIGSLLGMVVQGWTMLGQMAMQAWNSITSMFQNNAPMAALQQLGSQLVSALAGLPGQFMSIGSQIISGLISGIKAKIGGAIGAVKDTVSGIIGGAKENLDSHSPSRVFARIGESVNEGMAQGLIRSGDIAVRPVQALANQMGSVPFGLQGVQPPDVRAAKTPLDSVLPAMPAMPSWGDPPAMPAMPAMPSWGDPPAMPAMPAMPSWGDPPAMPAMPAMPSWGDPPAMPAMPAMPSWGDPPAMPAMPAMPSWGDPPAMPKLPGLSPVFDQLTTGLNQVGAQIRLPALTAPPTALAQMAVPAPVAQIPAPATSGATLPSAANATEGTSALAAQPIPSATGAESATTQGASGGINFSPTININAGMDESDPNGLAEMIETRLRGMFRDTLRGTAASMFD